MVDNIKNFGPNLRTLINKKGYKTYKLAADAFDISLSYLNQLMRNEREPSVELLGVICEKLEVSADDLLGDNNKKSAPHALENNERASKILSIQDKLKLLSDKNLAAIEFAINGRLEIQNKNQSKNSKES